MNKTNAMRFLDTQGCAYEVLTYDNPDGLLDVYEVAEKIGKLPEMVFKTLVTVGHSKKYYVFVVPAGYDLDLKKGARVCGEKSLEMLPMKQLLPITGYMHGGCSPIGLKKPFPVYIDESAERFDKIFLSAGKIGVSIGINPITLSKCIQARFADIKAVPNQ